MRSSTFQLLHAKVLLFSLVLTLLEVLLANCAYVYLGETCVDVFLNLYLNRHTTVVGFFGLQIQWLG